MAVRLYSGLVDSVDNGTWDPKGVPTIYHLIDALIAAKHELHLVFTEKEADGPSRRENSAHISLEGLDARIRLWRGEASHRLWPRRLRWYVSEAWQCLRLLQLTWQLKPDLVYLDRGNLWSGAFIARLTKRPSIYRVMGISPALIDAASGYRPRQALTRWMLRSPFSLVICTTDGSGGEYWLSRLLSPPTRRVMLLNGVSFTAPNAKRPDFLADVPTKRTVVLFVGRLEPIKGCDEFLSAFLMARQTRPDSLHAVVIGDGSRLPDMKRKVETNGAASDITFIPAIPHRELTAAYQSADVYVSLNRQGNLSNTNLEAFRAGCCCMIPQSQKSSGRDVATDALFSEDAVLRVPSVNDVEATARAIVHLHDSPRERQNRAAATRRAAETIPTWPQRTAKEILLLESIASGQDLNALIDIANGI